MLTVVGDLVADIIVLGGDALARGTDNPAAVRVTRGGSAANVAAAAASRHPARFIGRVGDDTLGRTLERELTDAGVDVRLQRGGRTGAIVVLVDADGERTMITDRGAAADIAAIDSAWFDDSGWVHLPLYGFADPAPRAVLRDTVGLLQERGIPVSVDLSSVTTMRGLGAEVLRDLLGILAPAVVFANADEAALAAELGLPTADVYVVKRGGEPVEVTAHGRTRAVPVRRADDLVDSTGAGDAFAAGYLVAALAGADPVDAAAAGSDLAMEALRRPGALQCLGPPSSG